MPDIPATFRPAMLWDKLLRRFGMGGLALLSMMLAFLVGAISFTIKAEKPWGRTVERRISKKEPLQPKEHAIIGLWWAAVANTGVLAILLATSGKWMPGKRGPAAAGRLALAQCDGAHVGLPSSRWVWGLVMGAVLWGAWERWPKLSQSLWNDEAYSLKRFVHGAWERQKNGTVAFEPVTWTDTLFENRNGNNHLLNSLTARLALEVWHALSGAPREAFSETAARMPHLIAGLGTILLVFLLGREVGSPLAGLGGAWLLALHPWHVRYSVEMRGYSLMLFFLALSLMGLVRALRTDRIRWWLLFGASEALFLLSFSGALYVAICVNAMCAFELVRRREWSLTSRLVAFNAFAAVPVLQWMLPNVPQILAWLHKDQPAYVTDIWQWLRDLASVLAVGWQYDNPYPETHVGTDWRHLATGSPLSPGALAALLALLAVTGIVMAWRRGTAARLIVIAPVTAALLNLAANLRPGSPMTVWYLVYLLIPATLSSCLTLVAAGQWRNLRWLPLALCAWFVIRYGMLTAPAAAALRLHDRQPMRETIAFIHAQSPGAMTATFGRSDQQHTVYDRGVVVLRSAKDLDACVAKSRDAATPLYIYYCSDDVHTRPDANADLDERAIHAQVTKSAKFEKVAEYPGSEELWSYRVYRLRNKAEMPPAMRPAAS